MRKVLAFTITAGLAARLFGQATPAGTGDFRFQHAGTVQEFQELVNLIRTITEIRDVTAENEGRSLHVRGTAEQVGLVGWLVKQLDQPVDRAATPAVLEFKGPGDDVTRILYLPHTATVQDFQEAANATRTLTEARRVFTYNDGRVIAIRDTPATVAMAAWMAGEFDAASDPHAPKTSGVREYSASANDVVRLFPVPNAKSVQDFQEIANATRTTAEIRRVFTINTTRLMAVRVTPDEIAMAGWLLTQLDRPVAAGAAVAPEYRVPGAADDVVRVYHLPQTETLAEFQTEVTAMRSGSGIRRVFTYNTPRAVAVRGTVNQLAVAEVLMKDLEGPRQ